jgi:hypothetical protein
MISLEARARNHRALDLEEFQTHGHAAVRVTPPDLRPPCSSTFDMAVDSSETAAVIYYIACAMLGLDGWLQLPAEICHLLFHGDQLHVVARSEPEGLVIAQIIRAYVCAEMIACCR